MGIVFSVVREVAKEVILLDDATPTEPIPVTVGESEMTRPHKHNSSPVVKAVQKYEIHTLCAQHNPVTLTITVATHY